LLYNKRMSIEKLNFFENPNNHADTESRLKALEGGVPDGYDTLGRLKDIDEEGLLGYSDPAGSTVRDWIRDRTQAAPDTTGEFDRNSRKVDLVEESLSDYEKEEIKLRNLTREELYALLQSAEEKSREGRGLYSHGNLMNGFAIDPETLQSLQNYDHDKRLIVGYLADKIIRDSESSDMNFQTDPFEIERRFVYGLVYLEVPGFKTPIAKLYLGMEEMGDLVPKEKVIKITNHLKQERKLLAVSSDFRVL
jgi:hypothetical protein